MGPVKQVSTFGGDEQGVTVLEYSLIAALVTILVVGGFRLLGTHLAAIVNAAAQSLPAS